MEGKLARWLGLFAKQDAPEMGFVSITMPSSKLWLASVNGNTGDSKPPTQGSNPWRVAKFWKVPLGWPAIGVEYRGDHYVLGVRLFYFPPNLS